MCSTPTAEGRGPPLELHPQPVAKGPDNVTWQPPRRHLPTSGKSLRKLSPDTAPLCDSPKNDVAGVSLPPVRASVDITAGGDIGTAGLPRPPTLLMTHEATYPRLLLTTGSSAHRQYKHLTTNGKVSRSGTNSPTHPRSRSTAPRGRRDEPAPSRHSALASPPGLRREHRQGRLASDSPEFSAFAVPST